MYMSIRSLDRNVEREDYTNHDWHRPKLGLQYDWIIEKSSEEQQNCQQMQHIRITWKSLDSGRMDIKKVSIIDGTERSIPYRTIEQADDTIYMIEFSFLEGPCKIRYWLPNKSSFDRRWFAKKNKYKRTMLFNVKEEWIDPDDC